MTGKAREEGLESGHGGGKAGGESPVAAESGSRASGKAKVKKAARREHEASPEGKAPEAEELRDSLLRLQAEFDNYKKRQAREREESRKSANERILSAMLPVLDNLERALEHGEESGNSAKMIEGVGLVLKQFRENLAQFGVEPIDAEGTAFDPHVHEAMSRVETDGDPPDGTVVEVYQKGYLLNGRVLRAAMVGVAKLVDGGEEGEGS